jgi:hypothetical protein
VFAVAGKHGQGKLVEPAPVMDAKSGGAGYEFFTGLHAQWLGDNLTGTGGGCF